MHDAADDRPRSVVRALRARMVGSGGRAVLGGVCALLRGYVYRVYWRMSFRRVTCGPYLRVYGTVVVKGSGRVILGKGCLLIGDTIKPVCLSTLHRDAVIRLGDNVGLNGTTIQCTKLVQVGTDSNVAAHYITDSQNHSLDVDRRWDPKTPVETAPVIIEENVWISVMVTVLHGVVIGRNSVIGAHSLVAKDIPADCLAYGIPARRVRDLPV